MISCPRGPIGSKFRVRWTCRHYSKITNRAPSLSFSKKEGLFKHLFQAAKVNDEVTLDLAISGICSFEEGGG